MSEKDWMEDWKSARNILCVRLDAMGDVLMTTPAFRALKQSKPDRRLALLTSASGAAAAKHIPEIDQLIVYDAPWLKATAPRASSQPEYVMAHRIRRMGFDGAILFTVFSQNPLPSAFFCYMADIPLRLAYCRENPYQLLTHWIPETEPQQQIRHEARRQLDLVARIGATTAKTTLSFAVSKIARMQVRDRLLALGISFERPWCVIHPGATAASRRYPPELYAQVAQLLLKQGFQILFTGDRGEALLVDQIQQLARVLSAHPAPLSHSLAGELSLEELAALLELAPLLVSNNTGTVHVAAAMGTPIVDLYAATNPQHTPWEVPSRVLTHDVPCRNCFKSVCPEKHHSCLRLIEPETVVRACLELHEQHGAARMLEAEARMQVPLPAVQPPSIPLQGGLSCSH